MHLLRLRFARILSLVIFLLLAAGADAHVTRVEIISRTDIADGHAFGLACSSRSPTAAEKEFCAL
jgi:hypothetical protein